MKNGLSFDNKSPKNIYSNKVPIIIISIGVAVLLALTLYYVLILRNKPADVLAEAPQVTYSAVTYDSDGKKYINGQEVAPVEIRYSLDDGTKSMIELTKTYLSFVEPSAKLYIPRADCFGEPSDIGDIEVEGSVVEEPTEITLEDTLDIPEDAEDDITVIEEELLEEDGITESTSVETYKIEVAFKYTQSEAPDFLQDIYLTYGEEVVAEYTKTEADGCIFVTFEIPCVIRPGLVSLYYGAYGTNQMKLIESIVVDSIIA